MICSFLQLPSEAMGYLFQFTLLASVNVVGFTYHGCVVCFCQHESCTTSVLTNNLRDIKLKSAIILAILQHTSRLH